MSRGGNPRIAQSPGTQGEEGSAVPPAGSSWGRRSATDPLGARQGVAEDRGPPAATAQMIPPRHSGRAPHKRPVPRTSSHPGTKSRQPQPCPGSGPSLPTHPQFARPRALPTSSTDPPGQQIRGHIQEWDVTRGTAPTRVPPDGVPAQLAENYPSLQNY